jgi:hypothetical protein
MLLRADVNGSRPVSAFGIVVPRRIALWIARLWISTVIIGSLLPGSAKVTLHASEGKRARSRNSITTRHRLVHFFAFGSSFLVLSLLTMRTREELEAAAEIMLIGCVVELAQYFVYSHRHVFEWWDVRDDAVGIVAAFVLLQIARRIKIPIAARR